MGNQINSFSTNFPNIPVMIVEQALYNIDNPAIHWQPRDQGWVVFVVVAE